jgi:hypothetical protein
MSDARPFPLRPLVTSGALALVTLGQVTPSPVHGQDLEDPGDIVYVLEIDCAHRGSLNEGTRAVYSIVGISDDGEEHSFTPEDADTNRLTEADCLGGVAPFELSGPFRGEKRIGVILIELLNGQYATDALVLDSLQLTLVGLDIEDSMGWDENEGKGWCLSFDSNDSRRDWGRMVYDDECFPCLEFSLVAPSEDGPPVIDGDWKNTALPAYGECPPVEAPIPPG